MGIIFIIFSVIMINYISNLVFYVIDQTIISTTITIFKVLVVVQKKHKKLIV
jgi:hypothetical protein